MILQLLGTLLLTAFNGAMSVESQRSSAPIKETPNYANNLRYVNGGYVLKNVDTPSIKYFETELFDSQVLISYNSQNNYGYKVYMPNFNDDDNTNLSLTPVGYFTLQYNPNNDVITCAYSLEYDSELEYYFNIGINSNFSNFSHNVDDPTYFAIYFDFPCYLSDDQLTLFNTVFTSTLNSRYHRYRGWYSLYSIAQFQPYHFEIYSSVLIGNKLLDYINWNCAFDNYNRYRIYAEYTPNYNQPNYDTDENAVPILVLGHVWNWNIYFNNLFCNDLVYDSLLYSGAFIYSPDNTQYGLDDLFFNIADTPVIFITRLFSFELFGVEFYVAFMGIITGIAMIFIIRKIL